MAILEVSGRANSVKVGFLATKLLNLTPNFFSISLGLTGLAGVWRLASNFYGWSAWVADVIYLVATAVYLLLVVALLARLILRPKKVLADLRHPVLSPFNTLFLINGMLLSFGLQAYTFELARGLFVGFFGATVLLGGWLTGEWMTRKLGTEEFHAGYFIPTVAGSFVGADGAARFGFEGLGWMSFGIGLIFWMALNPIILTRLFFQPPLPVALIPTMAINLAPPVLGGNAYFSLNGNRLDAIVLILAGYAFLMLLVQVRLLPLYLKVSFGVSWWAFTFVYAVTTGYILRWLKVSQLNWAEGLTYLGLAAITIFIGTVSYRSLILLWHTLFSLPPTSTLTTSATNVLVGKEVQ